MNNRLKIVIPFKYDENWIGGSYYIRNLVSAIKLLPSNEQPDVVIAAPDEESFRFIADATSYRRLFWVRMDQVLALRGSIEFDVVFPYLVPELADRTITWVPDFQERYLTSFFTEDELAARDAAHESDFRARGVIFSSNSVLRDYHRFYPGRPATPSVVKFAVFNEPAQPLNAAERETLNVPERFYFSPNQFWVHKNHTVIIDALIILKQRNCRPVVCFSGKDHDPRRPDYMRGLRKKIETSGLTDQIRILGFLPREQQLALIDEAIAIIQPSLFEGWSTVVEDAKSAGKFVIASDLAVHREQLERNAVFFGTSDAETLANHLEAYWNTPPQVRPIDYDACQTRFGRDFMAAVRAVSEARAESGQKSFLHNRLETRILSLQTSLNLKDSALAKSSVTSQEIAALNVFHGLDPSEDATPVAAAAGSSGQVDDSARRAVYARSPLMRGQMLEGSDSLDTAIVFSGFSAKEPTGYWSLQENASLYFRLAYPVRDGDVLEIGISSFNYGAPGKWVELAADGATSARIPIDDWVDTTVSLRVSAAEDGIVRLDVRTNELLHPSSSDPRRLGAFVHRLALAHPA